MTIAERYIKRYAAAKSEKEREDITEAAWGDACHVGNQGFVFDDGSTWEPKPRPN